MSTVEQSAIRGLDVDKAVKGFALTSYVFKSKVTNSSMAGDSIRWYQESASDLSATSPSKVADIAPLATFTNLEPNFTRTTSYPQKYGARGFISIEDLKSADIDILARTILRLTRAVAKQVDAKIWDVITESQSPTNILSSQANIATWGSATATPITDLLSGQKAIASNDYQVNGMQVWMNPQNHKDLKDYLITTKGSSIPAFSSDKVATGVVMNILGMDIVVSNNVTSGYVWMGLPATACTWKTYSDTTGQTVDKPGLGKEILVWEMGIPLLTDPKASFLLTGTS